MNFFLILMLVAIPSKTCPFFLSTSNIESSQPILLEKQRNSNLHGTVTSINANYNTNKITENYLLGAERVETHGDHLSGKTLSDESDMKDESDLDHNHKKVGKNRDSKRGTTGDLRDSPANVTPGSEKSPSKSKDRNFTTRMNSLRNNSNVSSPGIQPGRNRKSMPVAAANTKYRQNSLNEGSTTNFIASNRSSQNQGQKAASSQNFLTRESEKGSSSNLHETHVTPVNQNYYHGSSQSKTNVASNNDSGNNTPTNLLNQRNSTTSNNNFNQNSSKHDSGVPIVRQKQYNSSTKLNSRPGSVEIIERSPKDKKKSSSRNNTIDIQPIPSIPLRTSSNMYSNTSQTRMSAHNTPELNQNRNPNSPKMVSSNVARTHSASPGIQKIQSIRKENLNKKQSEESSEEHHQIPQNNGNNNNQTYDSINRKTSIKVVSDVSNQNSPKQNRTSHLNLKEENSEEENQNQIQIGGSAAKMNEQQAINTNQQTKLVASHRDNSSRHHKRGSMTEIITSSNYPEVSLQNPTHVNNSQQNSHTQSMRKHRSSHRKDRHDKEHRNTDIITGTHRDSGSKLNLDQRSVDNVISNSSHGSHHGIDPGHVNEIRKKIEQWSLLSGPNAGNGNLTTQFTSRGVDLAQIQNLTNLNNHETFNSNQKDTSFQPINYNNSNNNNNSSQHNYFEDEESSHLKHNNTRNPHDNFFEQEHKQKNAQRASTSKSPSPQINNSANLVTQKGSTYYWGVLGLHDAQ